MCDYSLQHVANRPAKVGDKLVSTQFQNSITRGFAAVGEPGVAVCLLPGTELVFDRDVECDHALGFFPNKKMGKTRHVSGESTRTVPTNITMRWSSHRGVSSSLRGWWRANARPCCNRSEER